MEKIEKEKRIKAEIKKFKKMFGNIPKDMIPLSDKLIEQCAFMCVAMDELQETLNNEGTTIVTPTGLTKDHPAVKSYNMFVKSYNQVTKQLLDMLPSQDQEDKDELLEFINARK